MLFIFSNEMALSNRRAKVGDFYRITYLGVEY